MPFKDPGAATGGEVDLDELIGALLLIDVREQLTEMATVNGPATPIRADIAVLDGPRKGHRFDDTLLWGKVLQRQLRGSIGEQVLGRLTQGVAQPGKSAPWQLASANDADRAVAERYVAHIAATQMVSVEEPF